jgi:hypothetical protein
VFARFIIPPRKLAYGSTGVKARCDGAAQVPAGRPDERANPLAHQPVSTGIRGAATPAGPLAERTRRLVLEEFRRSTATADEDVSFEAALEACCRRHPEVPCHVALHAVAEILAEAGLG